MGTKQQCADELRAVVQERTIGAWNADNFLWPILVLALSSVAESAVVFITTREFRITGELARAGGAGLTILMLWTTYAKLFEWHNVSEKAKAVFEKDLPKEIGIQHLLWYLFLTSAVMIAFAAFGGYVETGGTTHTEKLVVGALLWVANLAGIYIVRACCIAQLYRAKKVILEVDIETHRTS